MKNVRFWQEEIKQAAHALHAAVISELPVGSTVLYEQGKYAVTAIVIGHTNANYMTDPRIKLRGATSGKEYWLDLSRITQRVN